MSDFAPERLAALAAAVPPERRAPELSLLLEWAERIQAAEAVIGEAAAARLAAAGGAEPSGTPTEPQALEARCCSGRGVAAL